MAAPLAVGGAGTRRPSCAGEGSFAKDPSYLSVDQAMADYATLATHLRVSLNATRAPVILFGGSYG